MAVAYLMDSAQPHISTRNIMVLSMLILSLSLFQSGLSIPDNGFTISGSTITPTSTNYTVENNSIIFAIFWLLFPLSAVFFGTNIELLLSKRVKPDGRIQ
jgi:hypothetical protein